MLRKDIGPVTVMGFARYATKQGVDPAELIAAVRVWQKDFLALQPGIAMHCFLGNIKGEFADAILATDDASFAAMAEAHPDAPSSAAVMNLLEPASIRLTKNRLLGAPKPLPTNFSCIEFGTFSPAASRSFSLEELMAASETIENGYLVQFDEAKSHFIGQVDETTYSEIAFVETSGAAREICTGYVGNDECQPMLNMFDPKTVEMDFWHLLA